MHVNEFRASLMAKYPDIKLYEESDQEWLDEGLELVRAGDLAGAQVKYEQYFISQPEDFLGAERLAMLHQRLGDKRLALMLIDFALKKAKVAYRSGSLDKIFCKEIKKTKEEIEQM